MIKTIWRKNPVWRVIGVFVTVIILALIAHSVVVYYQQATHKPRGTGRLVFSSYVSAFTNPYDGVSDATHTANAGGWNVKIYDIIHKYPWDQITVSLVKNGLPQAQMIGVKPESASLWMINETPHSKWPSYWYLLKGTNMSHTNNVSYIENGIKKTVTGNTDLLNLTDQNPGAQSVQGAFFIVFDMNKDGYMNRNDLVLVYASYNADLNVDITSNGGWELEFSIGEGVVCSSLLG